jgi:hypothetical protein
VDDPGLDALADHTPRLFRRALVRRDPQRRVWAVLYLDWYLQPPGPHLRAEWLALPLLAGVCLSALILMLLRPEGYFGTWSFPLLLLLLGLSGQDDREYFAQLLLQRLDALLGPPAVEGSGASLSNDERIEPGVQGAQ